MWIATLGLSLPISLVVNLLCLLFPFCIYMSVEDPSDREFSLIFRFPPAQLPAEDYVTLRGIFLQSAFAFGCSFVVRIHNDEVLERTKKLRDEAVAANQSKLTFIAKMR
jgi:hypothetical protein